MFRLLSVFPAPFTLEAAGAVADQESARVVLRLVECSLLVSAPYRPGWPMRYGMLETLRDYGAGLLAQAGEQGDVEAALARYMLRVAEQAVTGQSTSTGEAAAARWLDAEDASMRHVLDWAVKHDLDTALRLAAALAWWWELRGWLPGQRPLLCELAARAEPGSDRWRALQSWLGWTLMSTGALARTLEHCTAVLDVIGDREPSRALVDCLILQSITLSQPRPGPGGGRVRPPCPGPGPRAGLPVRSGRCPVGPGRRQHVRRRPGRCRAAGPAGRADPGHHWHGRPGVRLPVGRSARPRPGIWPPPSRPAPDAGPGPGRGRPEYPGLGAAGDGGPGLAGRACPPTPTRTCARQPRSRCPPGCGSRYWTSYTAAGACAMPPGGPRTPSRYGPPVKRLAGRARSLAPTRICAAGRTPCARRGGRSARTGPARPSSEVRR